MIVMLMLAPSFAFGVCKSIPTLAEQWKSTDVVFEGKVSAILEGTGTDEDWMKVQFDVKQRHKGLKAATSLEVRTARVNGWVGFEKGKVYTVYAMRAGRALIVSECSRTHVGPATEDERPTFGVR